MRNDQRWMRYGSCTRITFVLVNKRVMSQGMIVVLVQELRYVETNRHHLSMYPLFKPSSSSYLSPKASWISDSRHFHSWGRKNPTNIKVRSPVQPCTSLLCSSPSIYLQSQWGVFNFVPLRRRRIQYQITAWQWGSLMYPCQIEKRRCGPLTCRKVLGKPGTQCKVWKIL